MTLTAVGEALQDELLSWWETEQLDWDDLVAQPGGDAGGGAAVGVWDGMPSVDSKAVARSSPIFEKHLGVPLDVRLIRPGGYERIEDVIADLVPKMVAKKTQSDKESA